MRHCESRLDWEKSGRLEWLETNGLGGYASSTVAGANTRRYHGLLVPAVKPPLGRFVLLSKLDERIRVGGEWLDLASNIYPGAVHPRGFERLVAFKRDLFPVFEFSAGGARIRKTIAAIHDENSTVIVYESSAPVTMELRPFIAGRDYHSLTTANDAIRRDATFDGGVFSLSPYDGVPPLHLSVPHSTFQAKPEWYYRFEYPIERERGLEWHEDLFTPGTFTVTFGPDAPLAIIASTEDSRGREGAALLDRERRRRERVIESAPVIGRRLALAADQFIVRRGNDRRTIIAGYHWFTDWGRDTMIALPGLCLATHRFEDARRILTAFAECESEGMLPNRFPDAGEQPEYNSVDAALWFFVAAKKYLDATRDDAFVRDVLLPVLRNIVAWYSRGTRYNIHEDADGLLIAGAPGIQLTWMDVKIGDRVVTPRHGKPVEVNALWYNALMILADLDKNAELAAKATRVRQRFNEVFWNEETGCLYDVIGDATIRPNQIFALSLPYPLIDGDRAEGVLRVIEQRLLTPMGLRTLDPADPRFVPKFEGTVAERDGAYHQGTVWAWLIGPYVTAVRRVRGRTRAALQEIEKNLDDACVGSISEIFDATEPFAPRGCVAQAWSVGEVARVLAEDLKK
jgi:predicted glycogen debranching enzyme